MMILTHPATLRPEHNTAGLGRRRAGSRGVEAIERGRPKTATR